MTREEKEYIKAIVEPFKDQVTSIEKWYSYNQGKKWEYIKIIYEEVYGSDSVRLPWFVPGTRFKDMELFKKYTLEETIKWKTN